jgi:hypothetical protein
MHKYIHPTSQCNITCKILKTYTSRTQNTNFVRFYVILNSTHKLSHVTLKAPKTRVSQHGSRSKFGSHRYSEWVTKQRFAVWFYSISSYSFHNVKLFIRIHFYPILQLSLFPTPGVWRQSLWPNLNHDSKELENTAPKLFSSYHERYDGYGGSICPLSWHFRAAISNSPQYYITFSTLSCDT